MWRYLEMPTSATIIQDRMRYFKNASFARHLAQAIFKSTTSFRAKSEIFPSAEISCKITSGSLHVGKALNQRCHFLIWELLYQDGRFKYFARESLSTSKKTGFSDVVKNEANAAVEKVSEQERNGVGGRQACTLPYLTITTVHSFNSIYIPNTKFGQKISIPLFEHFFPKLLHKICNKCARTVNQHLHWHV